MDIHYYKEYSRYLKRDMEFKIYGREGSPCLVFPCANDRFYDWEDRGLCSLAQSWIDSGKLQLICVDSVDTESWQGQGDARQRILMQERWYNYICEELVPHIALLCRNSAPLLAAGADMGAFHAVNFFLRRPDLFKGTIALSGCYESEPFFGDSCDDLIFRNTPCRYLKALTNDDTCLPLYKQADRLILCVGQGYGEDAFLNSTLKLKELLAAHDIPSFVDVWGADVTHDWGWWKKQWVYFLKMFLGEA